MWKAVHPGAVLWAHHAGRHVAGEGEGRAAVVDMRCSEEGNQVWHAEHPGAILWAHHAGGHVAGERMRIAQAAAAGRAVEHQYIPWRHILQLPPDHRLVCLRSLLKSLIRAQRSALCFKVRQTRCQAA